MGTNPNFRVFFESGFCYVIQAGLKLMILLLPPLELMDYRCAPPCLTPNFRVFTFTNYHFNGKCFIFTSQSKFIPLMTPYQR
jgi:hypothetical protein